MAEAALIPSIVNSSIGLVMKCGEVAKTLNDIASKFKKTELSIKVLLQQIDTIKAAWERIATWSESCKRHPDAIIYDLALLERLDRSLECGELVIDALEKDLKMYGTAHGALSFMQRSRVVWNESSIQGHQTRVRDQEITMTLLLQVLNLPSAQEQKALLQESEAELRRFDESAYSIVPSRLSISTTRASIASEDTATMSYHRLSIDDDLFAASVYRRKYPNHPQQPLRELATDEHVVAPTSLPFGNQTKAQRKIPSADLGTAILPKNIRKRNEPIVHQRQAFSTAYEEKDLNKMKSMLAARARTQPAASIGGLNSLLRRAAKDGRLDFMEALFDHGANANCKALKAGGTLLHYAAANGSELMAKLLFRYGGQIDAPSEHGITPLHYAARMGSTSIAEFLIQEGANVDAIDKEGRTPLHVASMREDSHDFIAALIAQGANIEAHWTFHVAPSLTLSVSPLIQAIDDERVDNVEKLLELGADPNALFEVFTFSGLTRLLTPLLYTASYGSSLSIWEILLRKDADPNGRGTTTATPLHILAFSSYHEKRGTDSQKGLASVLLKHGADIEAFDGRGDQVLHYLASGAKPVINLELEELIEFLLEQGAKIDAKNNLGETARDIARRRGMIRLCDILGGGFERELEREEDIGEVHAEIRMYNPSEDVEIGSNNPSGSTKVEAENSCGDTLNIGQAITI